MKKIVILLSVMLFMVACEKGNEEMKEAKVVVAVYDENGKIATGIPVKMYNEKDYKKAYKMWEIYQDIPKLNFMAKETLNATDSSSVNPPTSSKAAFFIIMHAAVTALMS